MYSIKNIRHLLTWAALALFSLPVIAQPLNGTYTVGGTTPNYATLSAAITDLNSKGVAGPVTFNIRDGAYTATTWAATINNITGASATNRITIKSETNNPANVSITLLATAAASNFIIKLNSASYVTIKDLTLANNGATYGRVIDVTGTSANDSIINCTLSTIPRTASSTNTAVVFADGQKGTGNVFLNNKILNGAYGVYLRGTSATALAGDMSFIGNVMQDAYVYGAYFYWTDNLKFQNNTITSNTGIATMYGLYSYYGDGAIDISGNKVSGFNGYGMYIYYSDGSPAVRGRIANNIIIMDNGTGTNRGLQHYYGSYQTICNNTINVTGTSATAAFAGYFYYSAAAYTGNEIFNNVFSNTGGGYALYIYKPVDYDNHWDYNNIYTTGTTLIKWGTPAADFLDLNTWRVASGQDMNSIVFDPAFTNVASNLKPNAANSSSWSLNGRGVHIAGNDKDIDGNPRVTSPTAGVPDIGAYEFTPSVLPPDITPVPVAPVAGGTQIFLFGQDTVATIAWDATAPVPPAVSLKQYTDVVPPTIGTISATNMYFYTDINAVAGAYNFTANIYYKDPWIGTNVSDNILRLARKGVANPWVAYAPAVSTTNAALNVITTTGLSDFGHFTGVDVADNASAVEVTEPLGYFCSGNYDVKVKIANTGNKVLNNVVINWEVDGVLQTVINYATPIPIKGDVVVTLGSVGFANIPKNVKVWTSLPNGQPDIFPYDDTTKARLSAGFSGDYTVGGVNPNFATFVDALSDLKEFGVCGPVVFNIRDGVYNGQALLEAPITGMSAVNRVTFQSENHNPANVTIQYDLATATDNYVFKLSDISYLSLKDLTFSTTNATSGRVIDIAGSSSYDSIVNCTLSSGTTAASNTNTAVLFMDASAGLGNVFMKNRILNGSYGIYYRGTGTASLAEDAMFYENSLLSQYAYGAYFYYTKDLKFNKNSISTNSTIATFYGVYSYYGDEAIEIMGNTITGIPRGYGLYVYYSDGTATKRGRIANNVLSIGSAANTAMGIRNYYSSYMSIYNNSVNIISTSTTGYAGYFYYSSTSYEKNEIFNNSFANAGGGYAAYMYNPTYNNVFDYNNLYTTGPQLVKRGTPANDYASLSDWRIGSGLDMNSVSYNPGYTNNTNLHPDINNPDAWSLNGRGIHMPGNDKDFDGNTRVTAMADGVPDIGAFEFVPGTVPPIAVATPATPVAGTTQVFTFGEDTVAVISWKPNSVLPNKINVRQYTGTKPLQFSSPGFMYFYTDVDVQNVTHQFDATFYYKDPWRGTTGAEAQLKLAQKHSTHPWVAYNDAESATNTTWNTITANTMTSFGKFTGIDNGSIFSAHIFPLGSTVFCPNGSVTLQANTGAGYTYQWQLNGIDISLATNATYTATIAGDYTVKVTNTSNITATSLPVAITIVSSPAALISATGPLNYCPGGTLALNANTGNGLSYQWQLDGNDILGATTTTLPVASAGSYTVTVRNIGCATTSPITVVAPGPLNVQLGLDTFYCESATPLVLDAGYPGATYTWSNGATTQQLVLANQSGKFWVYVDAGPNCQSSDTIQVNVNPLPSITGISYLGQGGNVFNFSPSGDQNASAYLWIFSNGHTDIAKDPVYNNVSGRAFTVKLVVFNACGTDTAELFLPLDVTNVAKSEIEFSLYPNPTQSEITLSVGKGATFSNAIILNNIGQVVYQGSNAERSKEVINVSGMPAGHYIIRATVAGGVITKPFEIIR